MSINKRLAIAVECLLILIVKIKSHIIAIKLQLESKR